MGMDVNDKCFIPFLLLIYIKNKKNDGNHTNSEIIFVKRERGKNSWPHFENKSEGKIKGG